MITGVALIDDQAGWRDGTARGKAGGSRVASAKRVRTSGDVREGEAGRSVSQAAGLRRGKNSRPP